MRRRSSRGGAQLQEAQRAALLDLCEDAADATDALGTEKEIRASVINRRRSSRGGAALLEAQRLALLEDAEEMQAMGEELDSRASQIMRRRSSRGGAALLEAQRLAMLEDAEEYDSKAKPFKVVIIGAGASGLGAARWLLDNDMFGGIEVVVLEGRPRVGGRVHTNTDFGVPCDLGASWLHGHEEGVNPISIMAARLQSHLRNTVWDSSIPVNASGECLNNEVVEGHWVTLAEAFCNAVKPTLDPLAKPETRSLEAVLKEHIEKQTWDDPAFHSWLCDYDFEFGASLRNVSPYAMDGSWVDAATDEDENAHDFNMSFPSSGYGSIIEGLISGEATDNAHMRNIAKDSINSTLRPLNVLLNHRVVNIDTTGETGHNCAIRVHTPEEPSNATVFNASATALEENTEVVHADAVICTVPVGVLKANSINFRPALSDRKQDAIRRIGAGNAVKVVMEFETVFWHADSELMHIADKEFCVAFDADLADSASQPRGVLTHFWNFYNVCGKKKNILVGYALGDGANVVDNMTDEELEKLIFLRMKTLSNGRAGAETNLKPTRWMRSRWATDPFARCTYSYLPAGETDTDICVELGRRESNALWFAGEACHTSSGLRACVGGAWISGVKTAEELIRTLRPDLPVTTPGALSFTC